MLFPVSPVIDITLVRQPWVSLSVSLNINTGSITKRCSAISGTRDIRWIGQLRISFLPMMSTPADWWNPPWFRLLSHEATSLRHRCQTLVVSSCETGQTLVSASSERTVVWCVVSLCDVRGNMVWWSVVVWCGDGVYGDSVCGDIMGCCIWWHSMVVYGGILWYHTSLDVTERKVWKLPFETTSM